MVPTFCADGPEPRKSCPLDAPGRANAGDGDLPLADGEGGGDPNSESSSSMKKIRHIYLSFVCLSSVWGPTCCVWSCPARRRRQRLTGLVHRPPWPPLAPKSLPGSLAPMPPGMSLPSSRFLPDSPSRPAWSGPRASPTYAPASSSPRPHPSVQNTQHPPPHAQTNGTRPSEHDSVLRSLVGLTVCRSPPCLISHSSFPGHHCDSSYQDRHPL